MFPRVVSLGAGAAIAAMLLAPPALAQLPRQSPEACRGQPELKPLQPLTVRTQKGSYRFQVEYADTARKREYGYMCRKAVPADRGMLFDFFTPQPLAFWMRNTLVPLDIVYIGADGKVVSIVRNARPLDETPLPSAGDARAVLELAGGRAAQIGLLPGDRIEHRIFPR